MSNLIPNKNLECPIKTESKPNKRIKCAISNPECMHNVDGICCWVEIGDTDGFIQSRGITSNRFTSEAKKDGARIKLLVVVDSYYEYLKATLGVYPSTECRRDLTFPFDFDGHCWTYDLLLEATKSSVLEEYCLTLPDRSADMLRNAIDKLLSDFA